MVLVNDFYEIGAKLLAIRKKTGMTQSRVAELAGLSDRTYADIERGSVNMRIESILKICEALNITPDAILTSDIESLQKEKLLLLTELDSRTQAEQKTALRLLSVYLDSLK